MYLKDKENSVRSQSVNKRSSSCPKWTTANTIAPIANRFNFTINLRALGVIEPFFSELNGFLAKKELFWLSGRNIKIFF